MNQRRPGIAELRRVEREVKKRCKIVRTPQELAELLGFINERTESSAEMVEYALHVSGISTKCPVCSGAPEPIRVDQLCNIGAALYRKTLPK